MQSVITTKNMSKIKKYKQLDGFLWLEKTLHITGQDFVQKIKSEYDKNSLMMYRVNLYQFSLAPEIRMILAHYNDYTSI